MVRKGSGSRGLLLRDGDGKGGKGKIREGKEDWKGRRGSAGMEWNGGEEPALLIKKSFLRL